MTEKKHILQWWPGLSLDSALTILVIALGGVGLYADSAMARAKIETKMESAHTEMQATKEEIAAVESRSAAATEETRQAIIRLEGKIDQIYLMMSRSRQ